MIPGEKVQFSNEEGESNYLSFAVPAYLDGLSYEVKSEIMYSVLGLINQGLSISDENIKVSLQKIDSKQKIQLWSQYFKEASYSTQITFH